VRSVAPTSHETLLPRRATLHRRATRVAQIKEGTAIISDVADKEVVEKVDDVEDAVKDPRSDSRRPLSRSRL